LVSGTAAAYAQTSVTRQVTTEPVETVVTQGPAGTTVTRRILSAEPGVTYAAPPVEYAPPVQYAPPATVQTQYVDPAPAATTRRVTTTTRHTVGNKRVHTRTAVTRHATTRRTVVATAPGRPLVLTPVQRQFVYRDIVQEEGYPAPVAVPAPPPVVAQDEVVETPADYPLRTVYPADEYGYRNNGWYRDDSWKDDSWKWDGRPVVTAPPVIQARPAVYPVGTRLPQTVPLMAVPEAVAGRIPSAAPYSYAMVGNRVYLVDPATSLIVADVTQ
jgi:hypothetical protein